MNKPKSLDEAIKKSAVLIRSKVWEMLQRLSPEDVKDALYLVCQDCWSNVTYKRHDNGFLAMPKDNSARIRNLDRGDLATAYSLLMQSNMIAKKTYIKNNPLLADALRELGSPNGYPPVSPMTNIKE